MKKSFYSFIFYRLLGWKTRLEVPNYDKCVICAAPHTSNWDLFIGKLFYGSLGRKACFMMKKEWFFFPLGIFFKAIGGIPVNRDKRTSMVDQMAERFANSTQFHLAITPEGTRKANPEWKKGFYYIALKAQVPIILIGVDYPSKTISNILPISRLEMYNKLLSRTPTMDSLRISLLQTDIIWENKTENLRRVHEKLQSLCGKTDILVLPEMFSTGFSMSPAALAEPVTGETITTLQQWSKQYQMAITGSFIASDSDPASVQHYYNRGFFLTPEGESHFYDKRHLFRIGMEGEQYTAGNQRPIITYKGWHILLLICYDLRFPVWSRNVDNEYDLLIYVASWPSSRRNAFSSAILSRADTACRKFPRTDSRFC